MKALLTVFAFLSFVAASALPMTASAEDMKSDQTTTAPKPDTAAKPDAGMSTDKGAMDQNAGKSTNATMPSHKPTHKAATHTTKHRKTTKKKTHHRHTATHKPKPKNTSMTPKQG